MARDKLLIWLERSLFVVAVVCLGTWTAVTLHARIVEAREGRHLDRLLASRPAISATVRRAVAQVPRDPLIGRIEIPRVGVTAVILEGDDQATLAEAVGHIPGTALPGRAGNTGLAGHRDSFFRGLSAVRRNDVVTVTTLAGTFHYVVQSTRIVSPEDVQVLAASQDPILTLVTCYPFHYIGPAPKRFIVSARLVGAEKPGAGLAAADR
jgi:sortase A